MASNVMVCASRAPRAAHSPENLDFNRDINITEVLRACSNL